MALVKLYKIPEMDMQYEHIPFFKDKNSQYDWIEERLVATVEAEISVYPNRRSITIGKSIQEIKALGVDYVSYVSEGGKIIYNFLYDYEYKTKEVTTLIIVVDSFQTYYYDCKLLPSFVDRCHVPRWGNDLLPTMNIQEEGLQFGSYVLAHQQKTEARPEIKYRDKYLIASTVPLGVTDFKKTTTKKIELTKEEEERIKKERIKEVEKLENIKKASIEKTHKEILEKINKAKELQIEEERKRVEERIKKGELEEEKITKEQIIFNEVVEANKEFIESIRKKK